MDKSNTLKYKYIVVGYGFDYYDYVYGQLNELPNATFINEWPVSRVARRLIWYHLSCNLPFQQVWVYFYVLFLKKIVREMHFVTTDRICFLLLAGGANNALLKYRLCERIKKTFVNSKIVFFINDLVGKTGQPVSLMKEYADLVYSYDPNDCIKYSLINHVIPYSDYTFQQVDSPEYDVVFVGAAKDRLNDIMSIYFALTEKGVACYFRIIDVPEDAQIQIEGVFYSGRITYEENLRLLQKGNCILDIIQGDSSGNTIRVGEAVILGKKLLTNNMHTPYNGVFDDRNMLYFENIDDKVIQFVLDRTPIAYDIKRKMYPMDLFHDIENNIS